VVMDAVDLCWKQKKHDTQTVVSTFKRVVARVLKQLKEAGVDKVYEDVALKLQMNTAILYGMTTH